MKVGVWLIVMLKFCVAAVPIPLFAVITPEKTPDTVGVPVTAPALLKLKPVGNTPVVTLKVGAGKPEAVQLKV